MTNINSRCYKCMNKLDNNTKFCPVCGCEINNEKLLKFALNPGTILNERYTVGHIMKKNNKTLTYIGLDEHLESKVLIMELFLENIVSRLESKIIVKNYENDKIFEEIKKSFFIIHQNLVKLRAFPNIVKIYSVFTQNNTVYIVKEFPKGISFNEYLSNNYGELSWDHSSKLFLELINLLKHIHSNKIIHCNLNPNTLFINNNILKITDFTKSHFNGSVYDLNFTLNDGYSAPEQYDKKEIGTYTDVYSIAAIMYKALTGTKPVNSKSRLSNDNLLPPNILNINIPKNVSYAIMSALVLAPRLRTQTMKDFYEDLTAPAREIKKIQFSEQNSIKQKVKPTKIKDKQNNKKQSKEVKETKTKNIIFTSFLISCSIASFFLVIAIFILFGESLFE